MRRIPEVQIFAADWPSVLRLFSIGQQVVVLYSSIVRNVRVYQPSRLDKSGYYLPLLLLRHEHLTP